MRLTAFLAAAAIAFALLASHTHANEAAAVDELKAAARTEAELTTAVDAGIAALLERDGVTRAPQASDEEFVRRLYLDVTGMPPTADEALGFLADDSPAKRGRLIDALIADRRFAEHLADQWITVLMGRARSLDNADLILGTWLAAQIHEGRGFDAIMHDIITAEGRMTESPASAYYSGKRSLLTADVAGEAARHFTGVQIQCAECHDHPYEEAWSEATFNGVASFFAGLRVRRPGDIRPRQGNVSTRGLRRIDPAVVQRRMAAAQGDEQRLRIYAGQRYRAPKFLDGDEVKEGSSEAWRGKWADWVVAPENGQTRRYLANRLWSFLFGTGFVEPVDDFNSMNLPSHPELLDTLAEDMQHSGWDVRRFYRAVLKSRTWQSASSGASGDHGTVETWHFAQYAVRQLTPEQLFGALIVLQSQSAAGERRIRNSANPYTRQRTQGQAYEKRKEEGNLPENRRVFTYDFESIDALEEMVGSISTEWYLRRTSSRAYARISSDDESTEADTITLTIDQALLLMNGNATSQLAAFGRGSVLELVSSGSEEIDSRLERLFLGALARRPTEAERERFKAFIAEAENKRQAWEDALMALMLSAEFLTNH